MVGNDSVLAISSALDAGGAKKVTMHSNLRYKCCHPSLDGVCRNLQETHDPETADQPGGPGSTVSKGVWLYREVGVRTMPRCPVNFRLSQFRFSWFTEGEDDLAQVTAQPLPGFDPEDWYWWW